MTQPSTPPEVPEPAPDALAELRDRVGRIAHDFNNLLTVIAGNVDFARAELDASHPAARDLAAAAAAAERATLLVRQLLAATRPPAATPIGTDSTVSR